MLRAAVAQRPPSRALADALAGRSAPSRNLSRIPEAVDDGRRALAVSRELGYPVGEVWALGWLSFAASMARDHHGAVQLARQAEQITVGVPGSMARVCSYVLTRVLLAAGDLAAAERVCAAGSDLGPGRGRPMGPG